jgi:excisionase family DNA binding protein
MTVGKMKAASWLRRGLSRIDAAAYVGVGPSKFDEMVADGRMPAPRRIDGRKVWDVRELDASFEDLPHDEGAASANSWEDR